MISRLQLGTVLAATLLVFCTLYTPQPILPQLARDFDIPITSAALVITVTLLPLGIAPILYGYFLQAIPARTMLVVSLLLMALNQMALFFATEFWHLLSLRFIQGLWLPAVFTSAMTYVTSMTYPGGIRPAMGMYVAATIAGGFAGRVLSGYLGSTWGWQWVFLALGTILLIPTYLCTKLKADAQLNFQRLDVRAVIRVFRVPHYVWSYLALFTVFFCFTGILAMLPFRIEAIRPETSSWVISLAYTGYLIGIPAALISDRLVVVQGDQTVLLIGAGIILCAMILFLFPSLFLCFGLMVGLAAGMFLIHSTLAGFLNHTAREHKGVVNGIYVSVYYLSGTLGSWLPVVMYRRLTWEGTIIVFIVLTLLSIGFFRRLNRSDAH